jgi:ATP-dependent Clp endopeptidase proteolytic subunit ClpP
MDTLFTEKEELIYIIEESNEIHFNASITPKTISLLITKLLSLQKTLLKKEHSLKRKFDDIVQTTDKDLIKIKMKIEPIKLFITSNGGYIYQAFSAIDTIQHMKVPVHTICKGYVASTGTLLSLAGKKRFITENSYMLIHELRSGSWGKFSHQVDNFENSSNLMEHIKQYYIKNTKITKEELDEQLKKDQDWNAEKCLEKGLVDEIIKQK